MIKSRIVVDLNELKYFKEALHGVYNYIEENLSSIEIDINKVIANFKSTLERITDEKEKKYQKIQAINYNIANYTNDTEEIDEDGLNSMVIEKNKLIEQQDLYEYWLSKAKEEYLSFYEVIKIKRNENNEKIIQIKQLLNLSDKFLDAFIHLIKISNTEIVGDNSEKISSSLNSKKQSPSDKNSFKGVLKGEEIELSNVIVKQVTYTKRSFEDRKQLRNSFDSKERSKFLKYFYRKNSECLEEWGFTDIDILKMKDGLVPSDYQVHHKLPLDDGGSNDFDNLVLIRTDPCHKIITKYQNSATKGLIAGESIEIEWPIPNGNYYNGK